MARTYQTMAEIEKLYPNEWVLIDDPKTTKYQVVLGGYVVTHGADKLAIYEEVNKLPQPSISPSTTWATSSILGKRFSSTWGSSCEVHLRSFSGRLAGCLGWYRGRPASRPLNGTKLFGKGRFSDLGGLLQELGRK